MFLLTCFFSPESVWNHFLSGCPLFGLSTRMLGIPFCSLPPSPPSTSLFFRLFPLLSSLSLGLARVFFLQFCLLQVCVCVCRGRTACPAACVALALSLSLSLSLSVFLALCLPGPVSSLLSSCILLLVSQENNSLFFSFSLFNFSFIRCRDRSGTS